MKKIQPDFIKKKKRMIEIWKDIPILEIRKSLETQVKLSKIYGVHATTISDIIRNKTWNKLKDVV